MVSNHKKICAKITSEFESKLNLLNQEKDKEIEKLHTKISQLQQQFSESLHSFEQHEKAISEKESESEVRYKYFSNETNQVVWRGLCILLRYACTKIYLVNIF